MFFLGSSEYYVRKVAAETMRAFSRRAQVISNCLIVTFMIKLRPLGFGTVF